MPFSWGKIIALIAVAFVYRSSAVPATPLGDVNDAVTYQVSNFSLGVDPRFDMRVIPLEDRPVRPMSILLTALEALSTVALRDYTLQSFPQQLRFRGPVSSEVLIYVVPVPPAVSVLNEITTQCIYYGVANLAEDNLFVEAKFQCLWDNVHVADVNIRKKTSVRARDINSRATGSTEALGEEIQTEYGYLDDAPNIDVKTVFITIMNAIKSLSLEGPTKVMTGLLHTDPGPQWDASIIYPDGPTHRPTRRQPPFLKYRYVVASMKPAQEYMVQHRRYAELIFKFVVDGVYIGDALLIKGKPDRLASRNESSVATA
ncbi:MAG: hypothetical protein Q9174_003528 [Haloplaca sp. 1 TL-2023]